MKSKRWVIALMLLAGWTAAFGQQPTKASIMEDAFGAIRAEMVRDACDVLEIHDPDLIGSISNKSLYSFYNEIERKEIEEGHKWKKEYEEDQKWRREREYEERIQERSKNWRYLRLIIGDANAQVIFIGDELCEYVDNINAFRLQLKEAYETANRLSRFYSKDSAKLKKKRVEIEENDIRYKNEIEALVKECKEFNLHEANGTLNEYKGFVFKPIIDKGIQTQVLSICNEWEDFETVLKIWPNDQSFVNEVYEKCWKYCKERGEIENYRQYISLVKAYGGELHFKEAEDKINDFSNLKEYGPKKYGTTLLVIVVLETIVLILLIVFFCRRKKTSERTKNWKEDYKKQ